jgi:inosine-uridine nucleoside N-ribohydrolase
MPYLRYVRMLPSLCALSIILLLGASLTKACDQRLVIVDNDFAGPPDTLSDLRCALMFLENPTVKVLGFTVVTGDAWRDEEVAHLLRLEEISEKTDVPVVPGAIYPLINTQQDTNDWEKRFGHIGYKGAWDSKQDRQNEPAYKPHSANEVPPLPEGSPHTVPATGFAAQFMVEQVRAHPYQVTIFAAGPLTDIALAVRMDPEFPRLAKELVFMGASLPPNDPDFNVRFDPEAAHIVLTAPWTAITSVCGVTYRVVFEQVDQERIQSTDNPVAKFVSTYSTGDISQHRLWDETAAAVFLDPALVKDERTLYLDVIVDHERYYGSVVIQDGARLDQSRTKVRVIDQIDIGRFKEDFIKAMTARAPYK